MQWNYTEADVSRFWAKVDTSGECWPWTGALTADGYGSFHLNGRTIYAHHFAWVMAGGLIVPKRDIRHLTCDNPPCVRRTHLARGTHAANMGDMVAHGRAAVGLRHGMHTHPERRATGLRNGVYTKPERRSTGRGERAHTAKLTAALAAEIRERYANGGVTHRSLAREYGVDHTVIGDVLRRDSWAHI